MSTANLDRLFEEVKALTADEQRSLRDMVDALLVSGVAEATAEVVELRLLGKGLLSRIPPRTRDPNVYAGRRPAKEDGRPVSENIVEERR